MVESGGVEDKGERNVQLLNKRKLYIKSAGFSLSFPTFFRMS